MNTIEIKVSRMGNSRGIRLPNRLLRKYHITDTILVEEKCDEIVLRPGRLVEKKLSWEHTAKEMAGSNENWAEWDSVASDGADEL